MWALDEVTISIGLIAFCVWGILIYWIVNRRPPNSRPKYHKAGSYGRSQFPARNRTGFRVLSQFPASRYPQSINVPDIPTFPAVDASHQLNAVMAASFEKRRLLSGPEYQVFKVIEEEIRAARLGHRVFAQTSLGEILSSPSKDAFRSINSKRVDILIVDQGGWPVVAVEYQGSGHYQGTAAARDAIKKEALRKAGVGYAEIGENDSAEQIRVRLREQLGIRDAITRLG